MSEHQRLRQARKTLGFTQLQVAETLGIGQNAYSMIETGKVNLTNKNRAILAEKLRINPLWLETGIGEIFLDSNRRPPQFTEPRGVPYYSKPITGTAVISLPDIASENPEYHIDYKPFNDCSFYRPIYGESMSPKYNQGDVVACQKVINTDLVMYGESYLCIIKHGGDIYETVKVLRRHKEDPAKIVLRPINPNFDDTIIPTESISELYIIKGKIERNL